jgi:hypothetical protein
MRISDKHELRGISGSFLRRNWGLELKRVRHAAGVGSERGSTVDAEIACSPEVLAMSTEAMVI